jgi:hypothetical protein
MRWPRSPTSSSLRHTGWGADFAVVAGLGANGRDAQGAMALTDEVIQRHLDKYELDYTRGPQGWFDVVRTYEPWLGRGVTVQIARCGPRDSILQILVIPDRRTPPARWPDMLDACNEWNALQRWPKVYIREARSDSGRREGEVVAEASIDLGAGAAQALVAEWTDQMIGTSFATSGGG